MKKQVRKWTVKDLMRRSSSISFPEYQREPNVWSRVAKQRLIDSMVRRFDIAALYFYATAEDEWDCVDGRQRIGAIMSFLGKNEGDRDNGFPFKQTNEVYDDDEARFTNYDDKNYDELKEMARRDREASKLLRRIEEYTLTIIELSDSREAGEFNLQFTRLNLGTIVNSGEKLHAMIGDLRDACFEDLGQHRFLQSTSIPTRRYSKEQLAAQILCQVFEREKTERDGEARSFARARHADLQRMFKNYAQLKGAERTWTGKVRKVLDALQKAFGSGGVLGNRAIIVSVVLWAYDRQEIEEDARAFAKFIETFVVRLGTQVKMAREFKYDDNYRYLLEFQKHVTQASVERRAVEARDGILRREFKYWEEHGKLRGD